MSYRGIGITTRNRNEVFEKTLSEIKKYLPPNTKLVVVDDASETPVKSDFRFETRAGIARAKNKCLELLMADSDIQHIWLFDDDCYPKVKDWYLPYEQSKEPHLMYIFTAYGGQTRVVNELYRDEDIVSYNHVRGCMLYFERRCIEKVGGFNPIYGHGYYEHRNLTERIHRAGLTSHLIMDVPNSGRLIHSMDEAQETQSTFTAKEHSILLRKNRRLHRMNITEYVKYD